MNLLAIKFPINRFTKCLICNESNASIKIHTSVLTVLRCKRCGVFFVPRKKQSSYIRDYYNKLNLEDCVAYYEPFRKRVFSNNWKIIKKWKSYGSAIDIGASFGWFLETAPSGWKVTGLEPSKVVAKEAQRKGLKMITGDLEMLSKLHDRYDLISLWNVLEHIPDPINALSIIKKCFKREGILALSFPNRNGMYNRLAYWIYYLSFGLIKDPLYTLFQVQNSKPHVFHFTLDDIRRILQKSGFEILKVHKQPIVDVNNLSVRTRLEGKKGGIFTTRFGIWLISVFYGVSETLNLPDEIAVYARVRK